MESFDALFDCCIEMLLFDSFEHMNMEELYQIDLQNNQAKKKIKDIKINEIFSFLKKS